MSLRVRQALPLLALALVLVPGLVRRGGPAAAEERVYEPFPASLSAKAPALPQYADGAVTRIRQHVDSLNAMWGAAFASAGATYEPPKVLEQATDHGCGATPPPGWAGLYCPQTRTLVIDIEAHVERHVQLGQGYGDQILGYVIAHEVGHHVQTLRGAPVGDGPDETIRRELQAECFAGVWAAAAGVPLPPVWAYGEDSAHGTREQQIRWLNRGYSHARPADCDGIWAGAPL